MVLMSERQGGSGAERIIAAEIGVGGYERHLLFCAGPNCCSSAQGQTVWGYLKTRLKELERMGLSLIHI